MTHTKEQVQQMEAEYPLDILVATEVMGYRWMAYTRYPGEYVRFLVPGSMVESLSKDYEIWTEGVSAEARMMEARHVLPYSPTPIDFSTNIAAAFQVFKALSAYRSTEERVYGPALIHNVEDGIWEAGIMCDSQSGTWWLLRECAKTPELAICRAALVYKLEGL